MNTTANGYKSWAQIHLHARPKPGRLSAGAFLILGEVIALTAALAPFLLFFFVEV